MSTPNLAIPHILQSQAQKEVTANTAFDAVDRAIAGLLVVDVSVGGTITLDPAAALACKMLRLTGMLAADAEVVVPDNRKPYFVHNATAGGFAITVRTAAGAGVIVGASPADTAVVYCDGVDVLAISAGGATGSIDDLADVDTSTSPPTDGQALVWDTSTSRWKPATVGSGGGDGGGETEIVYEPVPLTNPDAETGNLSGWIEEAGSWSAPSSVGSMTAAHGGTYFFYNESSTNGILSQTIDLIAAGFTGEAFDDGAVFRLAAWAGSAYGGDTGVIEIDWLDAADAVLDTASSGERGPTDPLGSWEEVTLIGSIPTDTRKVELRLQTVNHSGSNSTYAFDDIALEIGTQQAAPLALDDLADVDLATTVPAIGDTLVFDGTTWISAPRPIEIAGGIEGQPVPNQVILRYVATRDLALPVDLAGSQAVAGVAATAQTDFDIRKNGASVGTITFAASANEATFVFASDVTFSAGDRLTVIAPGNQDASLADVSIKGSRA